MDGSISTTIAANFSDANQPISGCIYVKDFINPEKYIVCPCTDVSEVSLYQFILGVHGEVGLEYRQGSGQVMVYDTLESMSCVPLDVDDEMESLEMLGCVKIVSFPEIHYFIWMQLFRDPMITQLNAEELDDDVLEYMAFHSHRLRQEADTTAPRVKEVLRVDVKDVHELHKAGFSRGALKEYSEHRIRVCVTDWRHPGKGGRPSTTALETNSTSTVSKFWRFFSKHGLEQVQMLANGRPVAISS